MRRRLAELRRRLDRLHGEGHNPACSACFGEQGTVKLVVLYGDKTAPKSAMKHQCPLCQQLIRYEYRILRYHIGMRPPEMPRELPPVNDDPTC